MSINLNDLSVELLLQIFQHCNIKDLCKLKQSCKRFNTIINSYKICSQNQNTLVTNQIKASMKNRSSLLLNPFEKWRISHNWKIGRYKNIQLLKQRNKFMPWLLLDKQYLWISQGKYVKGFKRNFPHTINDNSPAFVLNNGSEEDIIRFRIRENYLISGLRDGGIWIWSLEENKFIVNQVIHQNADVMDVDLSKNIFISSFSDKYSIWSFNLDNGGISNALHTNSINDKIWSTGLSPNYKYVAVGTAGLNNVRPFHVFDVERHTSVSNFNQQYVHGAGILSLHWENDNTVLTCGYDTYLKKWDLRCGRLVQKWEDPHDSTQYCLASDDLYTVITGASSYGRAVLWDQRVQHRFIQLYFTSNSSSPYRSSPVYSVDFDSCQMFTALDQSVTCLDFTNSNRKIRDYETKPR